MKGFFEQKLLQHQWIFLLGSFYLFFITNISDDTVKKVIARTVGWLDVTSVDVNYVYTNIFRVFEKSTFLLVFAVLVIILVKNFNGKFITAIKTLLDKKVLLRTTLLTVVLSVLVIPFFGVSSLGEAYAQFSADPFILETGGIYRRILIPAVAYYTQLVGPAGFYLLSLVGTFILLYLAILYIKKKAKREITSIELLSILSCGTFIFCFQFPGYLDQFIFIFLFLSLLVDNVTLRLLVVVFSLLTHETVALTVLLPVILFIYPRKELKYYVMIVTVYLFSLLLNFRFNLYELYRNQAILPIGGKTSVEWLLENPENALYSLFFAFKLLWVVPVIYLYQAMRQSFRKNLRSILFVITGILLPIFTIVLGIDATRLISLGSFALIFAYVRLDTSDRRVMLFVKSVALINIFIPSINYGLQGPFLPKGIYELLKRVLRL